MGLNYNHQFSIRLSTKIEFGWEITKHIGDFLPNAGNRVLFVTQKNLMPLSSIKDILKSLEAAGKIIRVYTDVQPEPDTASVDQLGNELRKELVDIIVAVGGGSVIDFAKSVSVSIAHDQPIWEFVSYTGKQTHPIEGPLLPLVAIPTTSGTGSEVTPYAVLSNRGLSCKATIVSPHLSPSVALVDPSLTCSLPPEITAYTGADALSHAIESLLNTSNRSPFSAIVSIEAIRSASSTLVKAVSDGSNKQARSSMSWASLLSGISISLAGTGVGHAMAELLGGQTHMPHGLTISVFLPAVLKLFEEDYKLTLDNLREALGDHKTPAYKQVTNLWRSIGLPITMQGLGIDRSFQSKIRHATLTNAGWAMNQNPVLLGAMDVDKILAYLWPELHF